MYDIANDQRNEGEPLTTSPVNFAHEIGPGLLRYDGTAFFLGAIQHTANYSPTASPKWSNGPDMPNQDGVTIGIEDGIAAVLVNGNILFGAGSGEDDGLASTPVGFLNMTEAHLTGQTILRITQRSHSSRGFCCFHTAVYFFAGRMTQGFTPTIPMPRRRRTVFGQ